MKPSIGILDSTPHSWLTTTTDLTQTVGVVTQGVVPILQGVCCAGLTEELGGGLDVVIAVHHGHALRGDHVVDGDGPTGLCADTCEACVLATEIMKGVNIGQGVFLDNSNSVIIIPPIFVHFSQYWYQGVIPATYEHITRVHHHHRRGAVIIQVHLLHALLWAGVGHCALDPPEVTPKSP